MHKIFIPAAPKITSPTEAIAIEGQDSTVILPFAIHSFPPATAVMYTHNRHDVQFGRRVRELANGSLEILHPSKSDAGEYMLTVTNARGSGTASIILRIFCEWSVTMFL